MNNYFANGAWISFNYRYTGKGYFGEVREVNNHPRYGESVLMMTGDGWKRFYTIGIMDVVRHK